MDTLLNAVIPIFGLIAAGYAAGYFRVLGHGASEPLNRFVFHFALPALLFRAVARSNLGDVLRWDYIAAFVLGLLAIALLSLLASRFILRESPSSAVMRAVNATYGNVGYLGIPLASVAYGERGVIAAGIAVVLNTVLIIGPATAALELMARRGHDAGEAITGSLGAVARNPLIVAVVLGLVFTGGGAVIPGPIDVFLKLLGDAAGPGALFALGLYVSGRPIMRAFGRLSLVAVLKLVAAPAVVWVLATLVFPLEPVWFASAVIMAGTPIGAGSFVLAERYRVDLDETSTAIVLTTLLSLLTLGFLLVHFSA